MKNGLSPEYDTAITPGVLSVIKHTLGSLRYLIQVPAQWLHVDSFSFTIAMATQSRTLDFSRRKCLPWGFPPRSVVLEVFHVRVVPGSTSLWTPSTLAFTFKSFVFFQYPHLYSSPRGHLLLLGSFQIFFSLIYSILPTKYFLWRVQNDLFKMYIWSN